MSDAFLYVAQLALIAATLFLVYRMYNLYTGTDGQLVPRIQDFLHGVFFKEEKEIDTPYESRSKSMIDAQIFADAQLIDLKKCDIDFKGGELEWLKEAISLYLIGAVDLIAKSRNCGIKGRQEVIFYILTRNLNIDWNLAQQYFATALNRSAGSEKDMMIRAGAKAANLWLNKKQIPGDNLLSHRLNDWGILA